jgi:hypothetical protein
LRGLEIGYELFNQKKNVKITLFISKGCNFFASSPFLPIFNVISAPRGKFHLLFGDHKQWGPLAKTMSKPYLKWCSFWSKKHK